MKDYKEAIQDLIDSDKVSRNPKGTAAGKLGVHENYIDMILSGKCVPGPKIQRILDRMDND